MVSISTTRYYHLPKRAAYHDKTLITGFGKNDEHVTDKPV